MGATDPIDYNSENVKERILALTNNLGVDAWIDNVGKESTELGLECLAHSGELVVIVENANYDNKLFMKAITVHNVALGTAYMSGNPTRISEVK